MGTLSVVPSPVRFFPIPRPRQGFPGSKCPRPISRAPDEVGHWIVEQKAWVAVVSTYLDFLLFDLDLNSARCQFTPTHLHPYFGCFDDRFVI